MRRCAVELLLLRRVAAQQIATMNDEETRDDESRSREVLAHSVNLLVHELRVPAVALRACCERVRMECDRNEYSFSHDYLSEMEIYCDILARLLQQFDILRKGANEIQLNPSLVPLLSTVIAPAIRFVHPLLRQRRFSPYGIKYDGFQNIPKLYIDSALLTQVVFNLLDNAIKFAHEDPKAFSVNITASQRDRVFEIAVSDYGIGIDDLSASHIFEQGFRGSQSAAMTATGFGLGLPVARDLVRRHKGDLVLKSYRLPTTFAIVLPKSLMTSPSE